MPLANKHRAQEMTVLWWGRFDPDYARNRILRRCLEQLGWRIINFRPHWSYLGDIEARWRDFGQVQLVWVPCFRHRDIAAARRWASRRGIPILVDALISVYDKQVHERRKFAPHSAKAKKLLAYEQSLLRSADALLVDTPAHGRFFCSTLAIPAHKIHVIHVGADESLFVPPASGIKPRSGAIQALFYGSFISLQGPQCIIEAAKRYQGAAVSWHLLGTGPLLQQCIDLAQGSDNIHFEPWLPYSQLPQRIHNADILLGIFGTSDKAGRVIPNKVYQAMACAKPIITRRSPAYPRELIDSTDKGIVWVEAGDPQALADAVAQLALRPERLDEMGRQARVAYQENFSTELISAELHQALTSLMAADAATRVPG